GIRRRLAPMLADRRRLEMAYSLLFALPGTPVLRYGDEIGMGDDLGLRRRDPDSLLNWMAQMIRLRKECPEIGWGGWEILETGEPAVLALRYDWRGNSLVLIHNFGGQPRRVRVKPGCEGEELLINLLREEQSEADREGRHGLELEAYGY